MPRKSPATSNAPAASNGTLMKPTNSITSTQPTNAPNVGRAASVALLAEILAAALSDGVDDSLSEALARHLAMRGLIIMPMDHQASSRPNVTTYYSNSQPKSWR